MPFSALVSQASAGSRRLVAPLVMPLSLGKSAWVSWVIKIFRLL